MLSCPTGWEDPLCVVTIFSLVGTLAAGVADAVVGEPLLYAGGAVPSDSVLGEYGGSPGCEELDMFVIVLPDFCCAPVVVMIIRERFQATAQLDTARTKLVGKLPVGKHGAQACEVPIRSC
jgi:hypothetical protein